MSATVAAQAPEVEQPKHPLHALTTYELRDYRRELEKAIAFFGSQNSIPPVQAVMQARLDAVTTEQADRARIART
jgi:hypothetical protein